MERVSSLVMSRFVVRRRGSVTSPTLEMDFETFKSFIGDSTDSQGNILPPPTLHRAKVGAGRW